MQAQTLAEIFSVSGSRIAVKSPRSLMAIMFSLRSASNTFPGTDTGSVAGGTHTMDVRQYSSLCSCF